LKLQGLPGNHVLPTVPPDDQDVRSRVSGQGGVKKSRVTGLILAGVAGSAVALFAQDRGLGFRRPRAPVYAPSEAPQPAFTFCRIAYRSVRREWLGQGWVTDYPDSDHNFTLRFSELTTTPVSRWDDDSIFHAVVRLTDDELFSCPFVFMSDVGSAGLTREEAQRLREYLLRGGFLWADDFWGNAAWGYWVSELNNVLPEYEIVDVPMDHPMLRTLYNVPKLPQVPSIQFWRQSGRAGTSERGAESAVPHLRAIFDEHGRALIVMTHNTDIADGWEREGEDDEFFYNFSPAAYGVGINIVLYALTH
jgi:hypothetical protein